MAGGLSAQGFLQRQLLVGRSDDLLEREAHSVAERVVEMSGAPVSDAPIPVGGVARGSQVDAGAPPAGDEVLASPARALDPATRALMESRFGHDFGDVRVHTDEKAAESARAVNASAFTVGRNIVFGAGRYEPASGEGRLLLAHELTHTIQQRRANRTPGFLQRSPQLPLAAYTIFNLANDIRELLNKKSKDYVAYRDAISKSSEAQKYAVLADRKLLITLRDTLDAVSFARCVESLGRKAPSFDELKKNSVVAQAISDAWQASDVGVRDLVSQPHEEGGWVFLNLLDGSLSIERAKAEGTDYIRLDPAPDVADSIVVAVFHTHPAIGAPNARPSSDDKKFGNNHGIPNLTAGNTGKNPAVFQMYLAGPNVRAHSASEKQFPGPSVGIAP